MVIGMSQVVVHLDFKGAPPHIHYLINLFPLLAAAGATALLVEYEDMFPFEGSLKNISALNAYTKQELSVMMTAAHRHGLDVIPLVQTFGHLEFALKLPEFKHLRELEAFPQEVCPSKPQSLDNLVYDMVRQVMELHPNARYLHIGCDEVFHIGACSRCSHTDPKALFAQHVASVAHFVRSTYPGVTPLIWDDMLRRWSPADHLKWGLGDLVEPVVWVYTEEIHPLLPNFAWFAYRKSFPHIWVAGAFKGASGDSAEIPNLEQHILNTAAWNKIITNCSECAGIFLTGWSRYDHFAVLCELLPVSVPSLIHNLLLASRRDTRQLGKLLECPQAMANSIELGSFYWQLAACGYPGSDMLSALWILKDLKTRMKVLNMRSSGWLSKYNIRHNFTSPMRVIDLHADVTQLSREVATFKNSTGLILLQYVDHYSAKEWLEQKLEPLQVEILSLEHAMQKLINRDTWPRRPL
ncbi:Hexosaminidase D [Blattella germanica]|nr:Hexosaminidase D [Blattella germanica]